ncbi:MAG: methyltransferase [Methylovirgula sp.]
MSEDIAEAATEAPFLGGRLLLRQSATGHRAGTDAILLAAAAPAEAKGLALDVGAGAGAAGLALAKLRPQITLGLIDNDPFAAALARVNLSHNGLCGRVYEADVFDPAALRGIGPAPLVITNPPFLDPARARLAPHPGKRAARSMPRAGSGPLVAWICACMALLEEGGTFVLIHKPEALAEILNLVSSQAGALTLLAIQPRADKPAIRILVRAQKGSRAPLTVAPALVLNGEHGFLPHAEAIHRGEALIAW